MERISNIYSESETAIIEASGKASRQQILLPLVEKMERTTWLVIKTYK